MREEGGGSAEQVLGEVAGQGMSYDGGRDTARQPGRDGGGQALDVAFGEGGVP
ncbi:hypothetical protein SMD44_03642 [Streptomyces alboflavus]|uniref:Uncharacterized protein n=1 Tax=Streptomyces alboflavus TaxID=67267 RepID=A0A1Z1WCP3_9ACTN|nr:hypothetical protein SMD44_03642 [Streptomyces alboflavus]